MMVSRASINTTGVYPHMVALRDASTASVVVQIGRMAHTLILCPVAPCPCAHKFMPTGPVLDAAGATNEHE